MSLRARAIRLAHANPSLRPHILPLLAPGGLDKVAAKDTFDFVLWALHTQHPVSTDRVIQFLESHGVQLSESTENKRGKPIEKGELVQVQVVNAPGDLQDLLRPFDTEKGTVTNVEGQDIVIKFEGTGKLLRVPGGVNAGKASGIYRTTLVDTSARGAHIEIVYAAANEKPPSKFQIQRVREYVEKGLERGEARASNYYSGYVFNYKISKTGDPYFLVSSQQRGGDVRTLSPNKGTVYYINVVGRRPGNWMSELEKIDAEAQAADAS